MGEDKGGGGRETEINGTRQVFSSQVDKVYTQEEKTAQTQNLNKIIMDYKEKYNKLVEAIKVLQEANPSDKGIQNWVNDNVPALRESEEWIRNELISLVRLDGWHPMEWTQEKKNKMIAWLEKQGQKPFNYECANIPQKDFSPSIGIEIPFGAKDSELQEATYLIPEGFHAEIKDDEVLIKKGKQKPAELHKKDEQNLNACLAYIPDEFLRRWLTDIIHIKDDKSAWSEEDERNLKCIMKIIKEEAFADYDVDEDNNMLGIYGILESWLQSIKQRIGG